MERENPGKVIMTNRLNFESENIRHACYFVVAT